MRKYLMALAVMVVAIAVSAPHFTSAAALKVTGVYRFRGTTLDNADRNDLGTNDASQFSDALIRPRWTFTSLKGKIKALYELDFDSGFGFAGSTSRSIAAPVRFSTTITANWAVSSGPASVMFNGIRASWQEKSMPTPETTAPTSRLPKRLRSRELMASAPTWLKFPVRI